MATRNRLPRKCQFCFILLIRSYHSEFLKEEIDVLQIQNIISHHNSYLKCCLKAWPLKSLSSIGTKAISIQSPGWISSTSECLDALSLGVWCLGLIFPFLLRICTFHFKGELKKYIKWKITPFRKIEYLMFILSSIYL